MAASPLLFHPTQPTTAPAHASIQRHAGCEKHAETYRETPRRTASPKARLTRWARGVNCGCSETPHMSLYAVAEPFVAAIGWRRLRLRDGADQTPAFWEPVAAMAAASDACVDKTDRGCCSTPACYCTPCCSCDGLQASLTCYQH